MKTLLSSLLVAGFLAGATTAETTITFGTPVPLIEAVRDADLDEVNGALAAGSDVDAADELGRTALHYAAALGYQDILLRLIEADVMVDLQDADGITPLMRAAQNGHEQAVNALLSSGADISVTDAEGRTALDLAQAHPNIASLLDAHN